VKIAEYQPTMYHVKALIVDTLLVSVGSTNFDNRSFSINDEANLNVLDAAFAKEQEAIFEADWRLAKQVTKEAFHERPWWQRVTTGVASLVKAQL
jgi:cardiolipin synthase